jgi:hypothetical protein
MGKLETWAVGCSSQDARVRPFRVVDISTTGTTAAVYRRIDIKTTGNEVLKYCFMLYSLIMKI